MEHSGPIDILLVEDSLSDAEMAIRTITKKNLTKNILHVENGAEALDFIFGLGKYWERNKLILPRLIILDLNMPKMNGLEVLKKIREDENTKNLPVVVFTSSKEDSDVKRCYELSVNSYIVKPVEFNAFSQAILEIGQYWLKLNYYN